MKHFFTSLTRKLFFYGQHGVLLLGLAKLTPAASAQGFAPVSTYSTGAGSQPQKVVLADVNGDGRLDVITADPINGTVKVLLKLPGSGLGPASTYPIGGSPADVVVGDVNADGRLDIVLANWDTDEVDILFGQAGNGFAPVVAYATGLHSQPRALALGDINGDGRLDIVTANHGDGEVGILLGQAGGFAPIVTYASGTAGTGDDVAAVALGDINRDGRLDIVATNAGAASGNVGIRLNLAGGGFGPVSTYSTGQYSHPKSVELGDVNADGYLDIVTANTFTNNVGVLLSQAGGFAPVSSYDTGGGSAPFSVDNGKLGDVNGDGRLDIVIANVRINSFGVLLGQAGGRFAPFSTYDTEGNTPAGLTLGDVNGDGRLDVVTAHYAASTIGVFLNTGTFTPLATTRPTTADISLYPNPAHASFTVQLPAGFGPAQAELLNALGQVVRRPAAAGPSFSVATDGLAAGIYTLRLASGAGTVARRVVVE